MIPNPYLSEYLEVRNEANSLAENGKLADGYTELLEQWEAANTLKAEGYEWALPLSVLYLAAMDQYCETYAVGAPVPEREEHVEPHPQSAGVTTRTTKRKTRTVEDKLWRAWLRARRKS